MTGEHLSKEKLQRHYDGDLSGQEAADTQQHLRTCAQCEAELASFERLGDMLRWSTDDATAAAEVDFSHMFAQIEKAVQHERESSAHVVPLHPTTARPRSRVLPTLGAVALAAAAVLMLTRKEKPAGDYAEVAMLDASETNRAEVTAVKFGDNAGQVFGIPLNDRESATVVWIDDNDDEEE